MYKKKKKKTNLSRAPKNLVFISPKSDSVGDPIDKTFPIGRSDLNKVINSTLRTLVTLVLGFVLPSQIRDLLHGKGKQHVTLMVDRKHEKSLLNQKNATPMKVRKNDRQPMKEQMDAKVSP